MSQEVTGKRLGTSVFPGLNLISAASHFPALTHTLYRLGKVIQLSNLAGLQISQLSAVLDFRSQAVTSSLSQASWKHGFQASQFQAKLRHFPIGPSWRSLRCDEAPVFRPGVPHPHCPAPYLHVEWSVTCTFPLLELTSVPVWFKSSKSAGKGTGSSI